MSDPHADQPVATAGPTPPKADLTMIFLHGRGGTSQRIISVHDRLGLKTIAALAPQAAGNSWYPEWFMAPMESNQPFLDSALRQVETMVSDLIRLGIPSQRIALLGFSQGACLATEFVARHSRRYGAVIALTGGLMGPPGTPRIYPGSLAGTPVFLGSNDPDAHIPFERVKETAEVLTGMGAQLELRRYSDMPHVINDDEVEVARKLLQGVIAAGQKAK